jgi:hypothetical protein
MPCTEFTIQLKLGNTVCPHCFQPFTLERPGVSLRTTIQRAAHAHRAEYWVHWPCHSKGAGRGACGGSREVTAKDLAALGLPPGVIEALFAQSD